MKKIFLGILTVGLITVGCTKYYSPEPYFEEYEQAQEGGIKNKVLIITVDGLVGSQIKAYKPTNIGKLMENAKYSYAAQADANTNDPASLVTLFTGYTSTQHKVLSESYLPDVNASNPHGENQYSPSVMYRIEERDNKKNTAAIMRNETFTNIMLGEADYSTIAKSDAEIKTETVNYLDKNNPDFLVIQFSDVQAAGIDGGFVLTNSKYKNAVDIVDGYIGEIKTALESRDNYNDENWLIIVCSAHGGDENGKFGGISSDEMNTFSLYYNKNFKPTELTAESMTSMYANGYFPGTYAHYDGGNARTFSEMGVRAQSPEGDVSDVFNPAQTGELTFEFKMKLREDNFWAGLSFTGGYRNYYNYLLGKDNSHGTDAGWHLFGLDMELQLRLQDGAKTENIQFARGTDGNWNHYTFVFKEAGTRTNIAVYVNGMLSKSADLNMPISAFKNKAPLTVGFNSSDTRMAFLNADLADVRVWNKALTAKQVEEIACKKTVEAANPLSGNLVAYYETFVDGNVWKNVANTSAPDLNVSGKPTYSVVSNYKPCTLAASEVFLQNIDLLPQVFYWLGMETSDDWKLAGSLFLNSFELEFIK
ncbi:LamG-like jellyroll fold domain-containing protein [Sphingobacterium hungaricum]|uniref:Type I phosphodiesterase / nucleotide pyrophosphatase n=1 Tax=Sphingobacterium hungaricum TaxID=2082723 RepID=A0A928UWV0_9SPHI|nr:LamG-like jellyroll fold domain-containing protein [Sphingobacterium hungaricum]MBE8712790.1 hypothetical protein [Sphingobacterium hungaricum]